ncbi:MAG: glutamine-hydrolyzing GMP synthase [Candidatus Thermoplasmatota archaeon]|nr:glutamine-hydrolyzing GMP synthase [Candidatus Thermoplasmatota archaeon]
MMDHDTIAVVDNGGQFAHLIATKVRDLVRVKTVIVDPQTDPSELAGTKGIILSGGPDSIHEEGSIQLNQDILDLDIPVLGLCYGMHEIAVRYGGKVGRSEFKEYGFASLRIEDDPIFKGVPQGDRVWMSHGDKVTLLPEGFRTIGNTENCPIAAFSDPQRKRWGFQFHPEVEDTLHGEEMLRNFAVDICMARQDWTAERNLEGIVTDIRREVGERNVLCLVSGGVDSTVVAALLLKALPQERCRFVHIDTGLMRENESGEVMKALKLQGLRDLKVVDASDRYLDELSGKVEPEEKRKIIGRLFIDLINEEAGEAASADWVLAQGTLYPDTIESGGTRNADVIKTHHNRVDVIMRMISEGRVIEPVKELYKAEVREVGEKLGLPKELVHRHPFPGPGLGIRALCQDGGMIGKGRREAAEVQPSVDRGIHEDQWGRDNVKGLVLPVRSVGVKGDARSYEHPVALWVGGTIPWKELKLFSTRLVNKTQGINRCVLMIEPDAVRAPDPMERYITKSRMDLLRGADALVMDGLRRHGLYDTIWQCPTVLVPVGYTGGEMIVIRPVWSKRAMTAEVSELPPAFFRDVVPELLSIDGIDAVAVDVTSKPPGTIEWE